jgi:hypothetical protein
MTSAFSVHFTSPYAYSRINGIYMIFSSTIYQYGNDFNISTGTYKGRIPGVYQFSSTLVKKRSSVGVDQVYCRIDKNSLLLLTLA